MVRRTADARHGIFAARRRQAAPRPRRQRSRKAAWRDTGTGRHRLDAPPARHHLNPQSRQRRTRRGQPPRPHARPHQRGSCHTRCRIPATKEENPAGRVVRRTSGDAPPTAYDHNGKSIQCRHGKHCMMSVPALYAFGGKVQRECDSNRQITLSVLI